VWGYALLVNGLACVFMVYRYGGEKFRNEIVNKVGNAVGFGMGTYCIERQLRSKKMLKDILQISF